MPRKKRKNKASRSDGRCKTSREKEVNIEDVAINDFANAKDAKEALKKISRGLSLKTAVTISGSTNEDTIPWYDRTDFDQLSSGDESEKESLPEQDTVLVQQRGHKKNSTNKKLVKLKSDSESSSGLTYPLDLWCLLSQYLCPEHIQKFCLICKGAKESLEMRSFWLRLYNQHVTVIKPKRLPERLRPGRIDCRPGLRARVIRALFQGYEPFRTRIVSNPNSDPSSLVSQMCISMWCGQVLSKKQAKCWVFYFKFSQKPGFEKSSRPAYFSLKWLAQENDIGHNLEEHHTVLQVKCNNFLPVPPVLGLVMTKALVRLSRDMKYNSVELTFHSPRNDGRYSKENAVTVVLDPAYDARVVHWWSPVYPHRE